MLDKVYYTRYNIANIKVGGGSVAFAVSASLLETMVLAVCEREDTYGYKITQNIRQAVEISESTLYPVLRRLQKSDLLEAYDSQHNGRNRRYYRITDAGRAQLTELKDEWSQHKSNIDTVLNGGEGE